MTMRVHAGLIFSITVACDNRCITPGSAPESPREAGPEIRPREAIAVRQVGDFPTVKGGLRLRFGLASHTLTDSANKWNFT